MTKTKLPNLAIPFASGEYTPLFYDESGVKVKIRCFTGQHVLYDVRFVGTILRHAEVDGIVTFEPRFKEAA